MSDTLQLLQRKLSYTFTEPSLAQQALTHRSAGKNHNERLEFLGDSVLGFVIAEALYQRMPGVSEGELSRMRANLVNKSSLEAIASNLDLGTLIHLGEGERRSGGKQRASILADTVEALIGAIYLDGGMQPCREFILEQSANRLVNVSAKPELKDSKTELQEIMQAKKKPLPDYVLVEVKGHAHDQTFTVECKVKGLSRACRGEGKSKRSAEQQAAEAAIAVLTSTS